MATKSKKKINPKKKSDFSAETISGLYGVRVVTVHGESKLELRSTLGMARESFGRLVNVSVRTIAAVESTKIKVKKLERNYVEVKRLCDALNEVIDQECLGDWFNAHNKAFGELKPIEVIERGEIDRLWDMVYRLRSGMPV